jgi:Na+/melibiose symporter-like transporter
MDKRTTGIIVTLVTVFLCGCPGLCGLCMGAMFALVSFVPNAQIDIFGSHEPRASLTFGVVALLIGVVLLAIPAVAAFVTLRKKKSTTPANLNEPIPPAI